MKILVQLLFAALFSMSASAGVIWPDPRIDPQLDRGYMWLDD